MTECSFYNYYEDLQVSPNADSETIERVYRLFAKRYHPDNLSTGDSEKFSIMSTAYKVLSDPETRSSFDVKYEEYCNHRFKITVELSPSDGYQNDQHIRNTILSLLYIEKRQDPINSGIGLWRLEQLVGWPEKILEFHVWYLKEKSWIQRTDTGGYSITVNGVDVIEKQELVMGKDRLLTHITESSKRNQDVKDAHHKKEHLKVIR